MLLTANVIVIIYIRFYAFNNSALAHVDIALFTLVNIVHYLQCFEIDKLIIN